MQLFGQIQSGAISQHPLQTSVAGIDDTLEVNGPGMNGSSP